MKAKLVKKDAIKTGPKTQTEPKPAPKPARSASKLPVNPRAAFDALFTKK